jgi:hypothetical protein
VRAPALAGALVGVVSAVALALLLGPPARPSAEAADAFLDAWARHRTATYVAEGTFTRSVEGEAVLRSAVRTAQRPPDRLEVGPGSATGRRDGRRIACAAEEDGELSCREGEAVGPYEDAVEREVAIFRDQFGPGRLYDATADGDCFVFDLAAPDPAPPYGDRATYCFDDATGALRRSRIDHGRVVDTVEIDTIRTDVRDEDLG